jgi:hypothetical protein
MRPQSSVSVAARNTFWCPHIGGRRWFSRSCRARAVPRGQATMTTPTIGQSAPPSRPKGAACHGPSRPVAALSGLRRQPPGGSRRCNGSCGPGIPPGHALDGPDAESQRADPWDPCRELRLRAATHPRSAPFAWEPRSALPRRMPARRLHERWLSRLTGVMPASMARMRAGKSSRSRRCLRCIGRMQYGHRSMPSRRFAKLSALRGISPGVMTAANFPSPHVRLPQSADDAAPAGSGPFRLGIAARL